MTLDQQLRVLRRQAGAVAGTVAAVEPAGQGNELVERLRRMRGAGVSAACRAHDAAEAVARLQQRLDAEQIAPGVLQLTRSIPLDHRQGEACLAQLEQPSCPPAVTAPMDELLFLDTETTGLSGGSGTTVFLLGLARVRNGVLVLRQWLLTAYAGEAAMYKAAAVWAAGCSQIVSYNGKSYDLPLLATRQRMNGATDPFADLEHMDLLYPVRRLFQRNWTDCRLQTAERNLLGFIRSNDLPGALAPQAWLDFLRRGEIEALCAVVTHNADDLISLAALLPTLWRMVADPRRHDLDHAALARSLLEAGDESAALTLLQHPAAAADPRATLLLADMHRRALRWKEAVALWLGLAEQGNREAAERLAKYFEHQRRDYARALDYARRLPDSAARAQRCGRLLARLQPGAGG